MSPAASAHRGAGDSSNVDAQLIVSWKPGTSAADRARALARISSTDVTSLTASGAPDSVDMVDVQSPAGRDAAVAALAADPAVAAVEPNATLHAGGKLPPLDSLFNDPLLADGTQWHLLGDSTKPGNEYGIDATSVFRSGVFGRGDVYVGVIDEGVDISHPDLAQNVFTNAWDPPNGLDDDGNGYVDDTHGWDFYHGDNSVFDGQSADDGIDAHGTIVAGEIAAVHGNSLGGSGAAPNVKVIPAKFLGPADGTTAGAIAAIDYITDLKLRHGLNIVATNDSWEGDDTDSQLLQDAIQRGADAGILFITISGNGDARGKGYDLDTTPNYPASLACHLPSGASCMIVTAAIDRKGKLAKFSNYGDRSVDIAAPGVSITSTYPFAQYMAYSGTSQAAPLVAATAAMYRSTHPNASATRIRRAILGSAVYTKSLDGKVRTDGRLDMPAALDW